QLTALMAAVNLAALGTAGLRDIAVGSVKHAHALADRLAAAGFAPLLDSAYFSDFVLPTAVPAAEVMSRLARAGVHAGVAAPAEYGLGDAIVLSATERTSAADIESLVGALSESGSATGDGGERTRSSGGPARTVAVSRVVAPAGEGAHD